MRVLLAIALFAGGILALNTPTNAARQYKRVAKPPCYAALPQPFRRAKAGCARGAWGYSPYDPIGEFRGFPGWARKAFSEGRR
jgi:hypothetical protein